MSTTALKKKPIEGDEEAELEVDENGRPIINKKPKSVGIDEEAQ